MADNETTVGILIQARSDVDAAVNQAVSSLRKVTESANATGVGVRTVTTEATKTTESLTAMSRVAGTLPGPLGATASQITTLAESAASAGLLVAGLAGAAVAAVGAMVIAARGIADYNEQMENLSLQTGLSREELGGLKVAAAEVGRDFSQLTVAMRFLNDAIDQASEGNLGAVKKFVDLGVSYQDAAGKALPAGEVFEAVAKKIAATEDPARRIGIAMDFLGSRTGPPLIPVMLAVADSFQTFKDRAEAVGITLSDDAVAQAKVANEAFKKLEISTEGLRNSFGLLAATSLTPLIAQIAKLAEALARLVTTSDLEKLRGQLGSPAAEAAEYADVMKDIASGKSLEQIARETVQRSQQGPPVPKELAEAGSNLVSEFTKSVERIKELHSWSVLTTEEEVKALESLRSQVTTAEELLRLNAEIYRIKSEMAGIGIGAQQFGPPLAEASELARRRQTFLGLGPGEMKALTGPSIGEVFPDFLPPDLIDQMERFGVTIEDVSRAALKGAPSLEGVADALIADAKASARAIAEFKAGAAGAVRGLVSDVVRGVDSMEAAFNRFFNAIADTLAQSAVSFIGGLIKTAAKAAPVVIAAAQSGGTLAMQSGGALQPVMAQSGLVMSGIRGVDTVPALLGRGETVLSHDLTDKLDRFLTATNDLVSRRVGVAEGRVSEISVPVYLNVYGPQMDRRWWEAQVEDHLASTIVQKLQSGGYRRE